MELTNRRYLRTLDLTVVVLCAGLIAHAVCVVPEVQDGHAVGLRLLNVQPDGPIARIGLQSSDVVSTINGLNLSSAENALVAYTKLRAASHLEIGFDRGGARMINSYFIR